MRTFEGKPVVDAKRRLYFEIDPKKDCERACRLTKDDCVVARAIKAGMPGIRDIRVGASTTFVRLATKWIRYKTTKALRDGLNRWDATGAWKLKKGAYYLNPPSPAALLGLKRGASPTDPNRNHGSKGMFPKPALNPRFVAWASRAVGV